MSAFVVDTNVPIAANGTGSHADPDCVLACIQALEKIKESGIIVIDDAQLILDEYMRNLSLAGQPGPGDAFMKWVWSVQADAAHCEIVQITPRGQDASTFEEFPEDEALANFDKSDRKFVVVALASHQSPVILNALDSDWADNYQSLCRHNLKVEFLCPQHVCPRHENGIGTHNSPE
jgi:hypothetical protein